MDTSPGHPERPASSPTLTRYKVLLWLGGAATLAYICRNCLGVAEKEIRHDLGLDPFQMGLVMSAFQLTYALLQIPTGHYTDRRGSRHGLPLFAVVWSAATALLATASNLWMLLGARLAKGVGQAGLFPGSTNTFARWIPESERALVNGTLASFMTLGTIIGSGAGGYITDQFGWQWMFILFSLPGLAWAAGFRWWFRDRPADHPSVNAAELDHIKSGAKEESDEKNKPKLSWRDIGRSPATGWICGQQFFRAAAQMFFMTWYPTYLRERYGLNITEAGFSTMVTQIPLLAGSLIGGGIVDAIFRRTKSRRASRKGVAIVSLLICAALVFASYPVQNAKLAIALIAAGAFFAGTAGPSGYTITIDMGGRHVATLFSTMNMFGNFGALAFPIVVGAIIAQTGQWNLVLLLFGTLYIAAAFCWWRLNPDGTVLEQVPDANTR